jgi:outer membrane receptor for ferrienterochelin and colicins
MMLARLPSDRSAIGLPLDRRGSGGTTGAFLAAAIGVLAAPAAARADDAQPAAAGEAGAAEGEGAVGEEVIVVTGTRSETPRAASPVTIEVIDRQRIVESGAQTVGEALSQRPGLFTERSIAGTTGISIQGLGPQYTLILVDGARQIGRTDGVLDLDRFGVEDIEQIEVVRGPSSVLYGSDALGGVVNILTRRPRDGFGMDASARIDGRLATEIRGRVAAGKDGYAGALSGSYRDGPAIRVDDDGTDPTVPTTFDAYTDWSVAGRGTRRRGEAWRFDAAADYVRRDLRGVDVRGDEESRAVFDKRSLIETATGRASAAWSGERTAARVEVGAGIYRDQLLYDQRLADDLDKYEETWERLMEGRVQVARTLGRHRVTGGGEVLREALESERLSDDGERYRGAVYAQDEWRLGETDQLLVVPAARLDTDSQFGVHATPRIAARWQAGKHAVVRASTGMGYRAPSFKELLLLFENAGVGYVILGNPELEPETSLSGQAGGEWQPQPWLWVSADAYVNRLRDMIIPVPLPDDGSGQLRFRYENISRARTAGLELYAIAAHGRAALELGWALTRARDLDEDLAIVGIPAHRVTVTARWRDARERFNASVTAAFTGHRPYYRSERDPREVTLTDRRVELRARVGKRFRPGFGGFLGIDNILDAGDADLDRVPPRTLYAGVELQR